MKVITRNDELWDMNDIVRIRLDTMAGEDTLSVTFTDGNTREIRLAPKEMRATIVRMLAPGAKRWIDAEECEECTDRVCGQDPKLCRYWPRDKSEYQHDECYHKNGNPIPMCGTCPRFEKRLQVCMCGIHPCTVCEE